MLESDREFEHLIAEGELDEDGLTPVENVIMSADYFGLNHLAG